MEKNNSPMDSGYHANTSTSFFKKECTGMKAACNANHIIFTVKHHYSIEIKSIVNFTGGTNFPSLDRNHKHYHILNFDLTS